MVINIDGFGNALREYKSKDHEGLTKQQIKTDLQKIFDEYGVNSTNFFTIRMITEPNKKASIEPLINDMAEKIIEKDKLKKQMKESIDKTKDERDKNNPEEQSEKDKAKKSRRAQKPSFSFNISEVGDLPLDAARGYMTRKMKLRGYTEEEINETPEQLSVLGVDDKVMELNISPDESFLDQMVELAKKLYLIFVKNEPINEVRNLTLTELLVRARDNDTAYSYTNENGKQVQGGVDTDEPDIDVSLGADGNTGANVENDKLTEEDLDEINKYGIEGIKTHSEMEDFRKSEEYEQILSLQENALSKYNDVD